MEIYSPFHPSEKRTLKYYFCPQGPPGMQGMEGNKGETMLSGRGYLDLKLLERNMISDGLQCDIDGAVNQVMYKLSRHKQYAYNMPCGPPGRMGIDGRSTEEEISFQISNMCYARSNVNNTDTCMTAVDVYLDILKSFQNPIECPPILYGPIGGEGPRGKPGEIPPKEDFDSIIDSICPLLLE